MNIPEELLDHLVRSSGLPRSAAHRVVEEVLRFYGESTQQFVRRRHRELQSSGLANAAILTSIRTELDDIRVVAPELSERQLRRMVYG